MKYELINNNNEKRIFNTIKEMTDILNEFECTKISDNDICFLTSGVEVTKKDTFDRLIWKIREVITC